MNCTCVTWHRKSQSQAVLRERRQHNGYYSLLIPQPVCKDLNNLIFTTWVVQFFPKKNLCSCLICFPQIWYFPFWCLQSLYLPLNYFVFPFLLLMHTWILSLQALSKTLYIFFYSTKPARWLTLSPFIYFFFTLSFANLVTVIVKNRLPARHLGVISAHHQVVTPKLKTSLSLSGSFCLSLLHTATNSS